MAQQPSSGAHHGIEAARGLVRAMIPTYRSFLVFASVALSFPLAAQDVEKVLIEQGELDSTMIAHTAAFDSLGWQLRFDQASVDTTVVFSDTALYSILMFGDRDGVNAFYYLIGYDRLNDRVVDLVFLHDAPDIDQSTKSYEWTEHSIWNTGEIGTIVYACEERRKDVVMTAIGRQFWTVGPTGTIHGGDFEPVK